MGEATPANSARSTENPRQLDAASGTRNNRIVPCKALRRGTPPSNLQGNSPVLLNRSSARIASSKTKTRMSSAAALLLVLGCFGCAAVPRDSATSDDADAAHDPAEPVNRAIFKVNVAADHAVMKPVAQTYADHVPEGVQKGLH